VFKGLTLWLTLSLALSVAGFVAGLASPLGGYGGSRTYSQALLPASLALDAGSLIIVITGVFVHRWRGLWLLVGAPFALFWPTVVVLFAQALSDCMATHPNHANWCY
jgi:hypothetical protein